MHDRIIGHNAIEAGSRAIDIDIQVGAEDRPRIDKPVPYPGDLFVQAVDHVGDGRAPGRDPPWRSGEERHE